MEDCLFCKIIAGEIPSSKVYEDENTFAFLDITPVSEGHLLVVPKKHAVNIFDIDEKDWSTLMETVRKLSPFVKMATKADGVNIHVNNEKDAGQMIFHQHIHIIPRHKNDNLDLWHGATYAKGKMEEVAEKIKNAMS